MRWHNPFIQMKVNCYPTISMTVSFMRYCTNRKQMTNNSEKISAARRMFFAICFLSCVLCPLSSAQAEGIEVYKAEARYSDDTYQLSADFAINLNFVVTQALTRGVALYFISEFTLTRPRWYWFDEEAGISEQVTKLSYNSLTRQYRLTYGSLYQNFPNLEDALKVISHQSAAPIAASLLRQDEGYMAMLLPSKDVDYIAATRLRLDVTQLPKPLQVNALAGHDWSLDSGWYRWIVRPAEAISAGSGKSE